MLLDDIDKDLMLLKWHKHTAGYLQTGGGNNKKYAHRIVLERKIGRPLTKGEMCDHINRNKLDNRRDNLRVADKSINAVNTPKRTDNTSGHTGVYKYQPKEYKEKGWEPIYCFRIYRKGYKVFNSRYYKTPKEAYEARLEKLKEYIY